MYLLQSLIIFAVVASNIHWQWTPNTYLASRFIFPNTKERTPASTQKETTTRF
jgi:hypothetical protein